MVIVWVAVELYECGSDFEGGCVCPEVVYESDGGNALCPEPELPAGLVVFQGNFECLGGDENHAFEVGGKVFVFGCG